MPVLVEGITGPPPRFLESERGPLPKELSEDRPISGTEMLPIPACGLSIRRLWSDCGRLFCGDTLMPPTFTLKSPAKILEAEPKEAATTRKKTTSAFVARSSQFTKAPRRADLSSVCARPLTSRKSGTSKFSDGSIEENAKKSDSEPSSGGILWPRAADAFEEISVDVPYTAPESYPEENTQ